MTQGTPTLGRVVTLLLPPYPALDDSVRANVEHDVTRYVAGQIASMPGFLRLPYRVALFGFEWLSLLRYGRPFRSLRAADGETYLALWDEVPIAPMRDFVKLIRSVALLAYFDHPQVRRCLEDERRAGVATGSSRASNE